MRKLIRYFKKLPWWVKVSGIALVIFLCAIGIANVTLSGYPERQAAALTGRKVSLGSVRIKPFNASITVYGFRIFEKDVRQQVGATSSTDVIQSLAIDYVGRENVQALVAEVGARRNCVA
jgi:hypothetical protein